MKIKKLNAQATIPTRGSEEAAGWDLYACLEKDEELIMPKASAMIGTGIAVAIPDGYFGGLYARSGLACKQGLRPANCVGVIDSDYRGEIKVCLQNDSDNWQKVINGERIAQLIIQPYENVSMEEVDELDDTERGEGGFGHTGK
jgi:dUTP pyrophosphatase